MFKITIEKIEIITEVERAYEKIADTGNKEDNGPVYGYVDKEVERKISLPIYTQTVEGVNIEAVIDAVNKQ